LFHASLTSWDTLCVMMYRTQRPASRLQSHPRTVLVLVNCVLMALLLVLMEFCLRALGFSYTIKPERLVIEDSFIADDHGLFVANPAPVTLQRQGIFINRAGFRSLEFDAIPTVAVRGTTVVLLGDSFTWGATAVPITGSFADLLRTEGYTVHNLGIPGTGPRQYYKVSEAYLPRLRPDVVVVALYLGNDILIREWEPPPGRPLYYVIEDAGWITPFDEDGNYLENLNIAYEYYHNKFGRARRFLREMATGTLLIKATRILMTGIYERPTRLLKVEAVGPANQVDRDLSARYAHTYAELRKIQTLAEKQGSRYFTLVLPALGEGCLTSPDFTLEVQRSALRELHPVYIDLSNRHYNAVSDCHLNNEGHAAVAQALMRLLQTTSLPKVYKR